MSEIISATIEDGLIKADESVGASREVRAVPAGVGVTKLFESANAVAVPNAPATQVGNQVQD